MKKAITDYSISKTTKKSEETQAKHHENMTDIHPINFSHKEIWEMARHTLKSWHIHTSTLGILHQVKRIIIAK